MNPLVSRRPRIRMALIATGLALGLSVFTAGSALAAPSSTSITLTTTPATQVGQPIDVALGILGTADVYSYAITFSFDPTIFAYLGSSASAGPTGGFDSVTTGTGTVTVVHTRLGTSPVLAGDLPETLKFSTVGSGTGVITASVTLVGAGATASATPIATVASPVVTVTPAPVVVPPSPTPTPSPSASVALTAGGSSSASGGSAANSLAFTGLSTGVLALIALAGIIAIAVGIIAVRRRTVGTR